METMSFNGPSSMTSISYTPTVDGAPVEKPDPKAKIPEGLLEFNPEENKVDESQMADFATPISDLVTPGPGQMMQNEMMGSPMGGPADKPVRGGDIPQPRSGGKSNPLGLTDEQYTAVIAGIVAIGVFSKPVQEKLIEMIPSMIKDGTDDLSTTGMIVLAALVALVFYFAKRSLVQ